MNWASLTLPQAIVLSVATVVLGAIIAFVPDATAKLAAAFGAVTTIAGTFARTTKDGAQ